MNKKTKRRIALFFISILAVSIFSTTVFAFDESSTASVPASVPPATSTLTSAEQQAINDAAAAKATSDAAAAKVASDAAAAKAASTLAAQKAWFQSQKAASASAAAAASSELDSSLLPSDAGSSSDLDIQLPSVGDVSGVGGLTDSGKELKQRSNINLLGIISLACIALSVLIILAVLFSSNRRPPRGGSGRTRYHKPRRTKKKHLLNDKYYRNMR